MRILLFPSSYRPVIGGVQSVVHLLARNLSSNGHKVQVVTNRYPRYLPSKETIDEVPVRRWLFLKPDFGDIARGRPDLFSASLLFYPYTLFKLSSLVENFKPDVVNIHFPDVQTAFALALRNKHKFRLVVSLHGDDIERWFSISTRAKVEVSEQKLKALKKILQGADAITACSKNLLKRALDLEPLIKAKSVVIYNGIDRTMFENFQPFHHPKPYLLSYGRFIYKKGFDILINAFKYVLEKFPNVDLVLAGDGEEKKSLEEQMRGLGLEGRIFFYGRSSPGEIAQLLKGCQFLVVPSRVESFGLIILEAFACGKTVIATRCGGPEEIIENEVSGILVEKENPRILADNIISLLADGQLRAKLEIASAEAIKIFDISGMTDRYLRVFQNDTVSN
ncbi:MAG: glycosyltransferase family 4 protein [Candidatus Omnitrophica bacterium]|nr:glycosyltransferase family 4 protein [Candidatus Omnitrophota bacterium]